MTLPAIGITGWVSIVLIVLRAAESIALVLKAGKATTLLQGAIQSVTEFFRFG